MNPTITGVIGPGFLNQVPTLGLRIRGGRGSVKPVQLNRKVLYI